MLGQDAVRPLLRGRWLKAADGQLDAEDGWWKRIPASADPGPLPLPTVSWRWDQLSDRAQPQ
ncbi:hypothetical protein [Streptomyces beijiangensis]|uniref:Uncharacterized protein n=1 Tax=Streptomyces beijiangensis TaxID=163361 RepID=A0A939FF67_9ACTN|nr:hypothetical protein [Streptomyces beijiangensis]MBO0515940.1 hypothetical protein [Streptomyces beijiangensis]